MKRLKLSLLILLVASFARPAHAVLTFAELLDYKKMLSELAQKYPNATDTAEELSSVIQKGKKASVRSHLRLVRQLNEYGRGLAARYALALLRESILKTQTSATTDLEAEQVQALKALRHDLLFLNEELQKLGTKLDYSNSLFLDQKPALQW